MSRYYFLGCALPPISIDVEPEISSQELRDLMELNLSEADKVKVRSLKLMHDLRNLKALWLGQSMDPNGNYDEGELEDILLAKEDLPQFIIDYLDKYDSNEDRIQFYAELLSQFFQWTTSEFTGFLFFYFQFERQLRLTISAIRAKKEGRAIEKEFQFEDPTDPFVAYLLSQKDAESIEPEEEYLELKQIFQENLDHPKRLHLAMIKWRLDRIFEMEMQYRFEIDEILGYYVRLMLIEDWIKLNKTDSKSTVDKLARE